MQESNPSSSSNRKPWPMRWIFLAIVLFIGLYTYVNLFMRKENAARHPYEEAQVRGGHELREVGWRPFPNAYGIPADQHRHGPLPYSLDEQEFEVWDRSDPRVASWSDRLPPLEQGEQLSRLEAPKVIPSDQPYIARLFWEAPEDFLPPRFVVFRQEMQILIVPRPPERFTRGNREQSVFIIPPEFIEPGDYEVLLSTEGHVNRWTFSAE